MVRDGLAGIPRRLWLEAQAARHRLLMLDYDGTLAPFRVDRRHAVPLPGTVERLQAIAGRGTTRLAIVSGRPVAELERLLGPLPATLVGEHGWEEKSPSGCVLQQRLPELARVALDRAAEAAAGRPWAGRLERKRASIVLHTRGLPDEEASQIEAECKRCWWFVGAAGLDCRRIDGGVELRVQGLDKGTAVRHLLALARPHPYPVYLGDDQTDEDAFAAVQPEGFGICVGQPAKRSAASGRLASWDAVPEFLDKWLLLVEDSGSQGP